MVEALSSKDELEGKSLRLSFVALLSVASVFGFALGISFPMLALALESLGLSDTMIGVNGASEALGLLASAFILPTLTRKYGPMAIMTLSVLVTFLCFLGFGLFYDPDIWLVLRFILGFAINGLFMLSETWLNLLANESNRGRYVGIYATVLAASFAFGPLLVPVIGFTGMLPYATCAMIIALGLIPLFAGRRVIPDMSSHQGSNNILIYLVQMPTIMAASLLISFLDLAAFGLLPVYAIRIGFDADTAPLMLTALSLGNLCLQIPIGWLSDRINRYTTLILLGVGTMAATLLVPVVNGMPWVFWPLLFFWGGMAYGLFTVSLSIMGSRYQGAALVSASAAAGAVWGIGGLLGPLTGGIAMDAVGPHGLMWVVAFGCALFLIVAIYRHPGALRPGRP
jgi:MFS family permease